MCPKHIVHYARGAEISTERKEVSLASNSAFEPSQPEVLESEQSHIAPHATTHHGILGFASPSSCYFRRINNGELNQR